MALTPHTLVLVGDKEGGVGDLGRGARIRVVVALCVEFLIRVGVPLLDNPTGS